MNTTHPSSPSKRVGIIWCNIGTPDAPTPKALKRYLAAFLGDRRIVDLPAWLWKPILHGFVLQTRPRQSAEKYQKIWTEEGSPLKAWTEKQTKLLQGWLGHNGYTAMVTYAMRYSAPSMAQAIERLRKHHVSHILILPAYPQYSSTTSASTFDTVLNWQKKARQAPEIRFVKHYHNHPLYIQALAQQVKKQWQHHGQSDVLLMSFHGVPERKQKQGDPYVEQCQETAQLLARALGLKEQQYRMTFQSRFGRARWVQPYTHKTLQQLPKQGVKNVDVICPGFVSDCLETLEEIAMENREVFLKAGGKAFNYIACLNDSDAWINALGNISVQHISDWLGSPRVKKPQQFII